MKIRSARLDDALGMAHVIIDTFLAANAGILSEAALQKRREEWTYEVSARSWATTLADIERGADPHSCIYVAVAPGDQVIGLVMGHLEPTASDIDATVGEVDILYVAMNHQGQGIGQALVKTAATRLAQMGATTLHIATLAAATQARRFYESIGGQVIGMREHLGDGDPLPLVIYAWEDIRTLIAPDI